MTSGKYEWLIPEEDYDVDYCDYKDVQAFLHVCDLMVYRQAYIYDDKRKLRDIMLSGEWKRTKRKTRLIVDK